MHGLQVHVEAPVSLPVETVWRYMVEGDLNTQAGDLNSVTALTFRFLVF